MHGLKRHADGKEIGIKIAPHFDGHLRDEGDNFIPASPPLEALSLSQSTLQIR